MVIDRMIQIRSSSCSYALELAPGGGGGQPAVLDGYVPDVTTQFNGEGHTYVNDAIDPIRTRLKATAYHTNRRRTTVKK